MISGAPHSSPSSLTPAALAAGPSAGLRRKPIFEKPFETAIGALVLLVAVGFIVFVIQRTDLAGHKTYPLYANFQSAQGIAVGSAVKMSGIKIGEVRNITLDPDTYLARVEIGVNFDVKLPDDSLITIGSEGLLAGQYIRILPGASESMLKTGAKFAYAQGGVDLSELLGKVFMSGGQAQTGTGQNSEQNSGPNSAQNQVKTKGK
ncbi:MAG: outer membrane lipid asymmetry maintenance protein MlaD [Alphaproteobacteria bacterium]|nr:outer membrane lipid asymmetry maintenance protein MlaD [Alphaproteobacteria bacterium]